MLGSLHCLRFDGGFAEPAGLYRRMPAVDVVHNYLTESANLVTRHEEFAVLAHVHYAVRDWPKTHPPLDLRTVEDEFRQVLGLAAHSGRALEVNTTIPMHGQMLRWWREEGGQVITFGSDAHDPLLVARSFREAEAMAEAYGFRPGANLYQPWTRAA